MSNSEITYTRTFQHTDWVDNVDRVQAGGANGFNIRFHLLEGEFDDISAVITLIANALNALDQTPTPVAQKLSLTPTLVATSAVPWTHSPGTALKTAGQTSGHGMMTVALPDGATIRSLRAAGLNSSIGSLRIQLFRQGLTSAAPSAELIAMVNGTSNPYDVTVPAATTINVVSNDTFKYYIEADLDNAAAADTVLITGIQIAYLAVP